MMKPVLFAFFWLFSSCNGSAEQENILRFYVGSSDRQLEKPLFLCEYDRETEAFSVTDSFEGARGPSYLDISSDGTMLYGINKEPYPGEKGKMTLSAFRIEQEDLSLKLLNSQSSEGNGPCHVVVSKDGNYLFTSNYSSGHVAAFPLGKDGSIGKASSVVIGEGTGPVSSRQDGPHAHQVMLSPDEKFLLVPDLGSDKVLIFAFDHKTGILKPNPEQPFLKLAPGAGPRHLVFHPEGVYVYVVNELNATVTSCRFDGDRGKLEKMNSVPTVDVSHIGDKFCAAIRVHPEGRFLYASTRGDSSSLAVFRCEENGRIHRIQVVYGVPHWPRDFNLDPSGELLMVAGERADEIALYGIDQLEGTIAPKERKMKLPSPGCILFFE